ncbi:MAG TPA: YCF48-related protein [Vicinamibacterales bacterium]|nr:YCF48-related protein [Vicinamibacterales bacterium]
MRNWILGLACMLAVGTGAQFVLSAQRQPAADKSQVKYRWDIQKSAVEDDLRAVFFLNPTLGWAAGDSNTILKTSDGGATWTRLGERQEGQNRLTAIVFTSATDGWADVERGPVLHTSDGGESWQPAAPLPNQGGLRAGHVRDGARYQIGSNQLYRTRDAGRTWEPLGELPRNDYESIFFLDDQHGWISGSGGRIASTRDGGKTWTEHIPPLQAQLLEIHFATPQVGWLLPHRGHQGGLLASTDGGATWSTQSAGVSTARPILDMQFLDAQQGFVLASASNATAVFHTANGGKNWRTIGSVQPYSNALSFPKSDEGWVVGQKGYIVHYHRVLPGQ